MNSSVVVSVTVFVLIEVRKNGHFNIKIWESSMAAIKKRGLGASNVIIIQNAEKRGATLGFFEFARIGIPLGFLNLLIYWVWLCYLYN